MRRTLLLPVFIILISGCHNTVRNPLDGLTEGTVLPECTIYNWLTDDRIESYSQTDGWHLIVDEGGDGDAVFQNGVLRVDVYDGGRKWYSIQVCFVPLPLYEGKWKVVFDARSDEPRKMILDLAHVGGDWYAFAGRPEFTLTPEWETFEVDFEVGKRQDQKARFEFNLGGESIGAEFRNLRIVSKP